MNDEFLGNTLRLIEEGGYDLALSSLEQYCQLMLRYKILVRKGSYPRTHSLRRLIRELGEVDSRVTALLEDVGSLHYFARLEEAYTASRYLPVAYERVGVEDILRFVMGVFSLSSSRYEERVLRYLENYMEVAGRVKEIVASFDPEAEVYVFGSVVRGRYTAASDIDILVVTERLELKYKIMVEVYRQVEAPVELHIVNRELYEKWYKRFIDPKEMVKI